MGNNQSLSDWRKLFRFKYEDKDIIITKVLKCDGTIVIPNIIGDRNVIGLEKFTFYGPDMKGKPDEIVISDGIMELRLSCFSCICDCSIIIPKTVSMLLPGTFLSCWNLNIHIPSEVTTIPNDLLWNCDAASIRIVGQKGSAAETYAKNQGLTFVEESKA